MAGQSSLIYDYASSSEVLAAGITLSVLGTIAVALRFIARLRAGASVGKDDTTILLALVGFTPDTVMLRIILTDPAIDLCHWYVSNTYLW